VGGFGKWIRVVAAATALGLAGGAVAMLSPADATSTFQFLRPFNGPNRYDTARLVAVNTFFQANHVILASGTNYPDALAASYYAGDISAPILLTAPDTLPVETALALQTLKTASITIVGGTSAVGSSVENQLRNAGYFVDRIAGSSRYQTALEIAKRPLPHHVGTLFGERTAILTSGTGFADALAAGPVAFANGFPILLTPGGSLGLEARQGLAQLGIQRVLLMGGPGAVSADVEAQVKNLSVNVNRIGGDDRRETAVKLAEFAISQLGFTNQHVNLANGATGMDALAAGPHGGVERAPLLLTADANNIDGAKATNTTYLYNHSSTLTFGHVFGGTGAVSDEAANTGAFFAGALPADAPSGVTTVEVFKADLAEKYFISTSGRTYRFGYPGDTYQIQGTNSSFNDFAAVINPGDTVTVNYNPSHVNPSAFNVSTDTVPTPTITEIKRAGNTITIVYSLSKTPSVGTQYHLQRQSSVLPGCLGGFGNWSSVANDVEYDGIVSDTPPNGCYQYRVIGFVPVAGAASAASAPTSPISVP
jgi:putative cell wall-binding protein